MPAGARERPSWSSATSIARSTGTARSDHLWRAIDDGDPPGLKLHRLPAGRKPACWRGTSRYRRYPIDFFVFGARAWRRVDPASFRQLVWTTADADPRRGLPSDHCPIAVDLD